MKDDVLGRVVQHADRALTLRHVSCTMRTAVHVGKYPLRYVLHRRKFDAATNADKIAAVMVDLRLKCREFDVVSIEIPRLRDLFTDVTELGQLLFLCPNLASLDLSDNAIRTETLEAGLATCTALTRLVLDSHSGPTTHLDASQMRRFCDALHCPRLAVLSMSWCGIHDFYGAEDAMQSLTEMLLRCPELTHVDLSRNQFDVDNFNFARILAPALPTLVKLAVLNLAFTYIESPGLNALVKVLHQFPALTSLDVRGCWGMRLVPAADNMSEFVNGLSACPALPRLNLGENKFGGAVVDILHALPRCDSLTFLDLAGMPLTLTQQAIFVGVLPRCQRLTRLALYNHEFGTTRAGQVSPRDSAGLVQLLAVLERCPALTQLDVHALDLDTETRARLEVGWREHTWVRRHAAA